MFDHSSIFLSSFQLQEKDDGETGAAVVGDELMGASEVGVEGETSGPVEKWSNTCKSKLAIIVALKTETSPIHQYIPSGENQNGIICLSYWF